MTEEDKKVIDSWPVKPTKCECGMVFKEEDFKVLRYEGKPLYLEIACVSCDLNLHVDMKGTYFEIVAF